MFTYTDKHAHTQHSDYTVCLNHKQQLRHLVTDANEARLERSKAAHPTLLTHFKIGSLFPDNHNLIRFPDKRM